MAKSPFQDLRKMLDGSGAPSFGLRAAPPGECLRAALAHAQRRISCEKALEQGDVELQLREAFGAAEVGDA
jgi:hypothetical protein